jgi:hypothetical protein
MKLGRYNQLHNAMVDFMVALFKNLTAERQDIQ